MAVSTMQWRAAIGCWRSGMSRAELSTAVASPCSCHAGFFALVLAVLLLVGGVEPNPGPFNKSRCEMCGTFYETLAADVEFRERQVVEKERLIVEMERIVHEREQHITELERTIKEREMLLSMKERDTSKRNKQLDKRGVKAKKKEHLLNLRDIEASKRENSLDAWEKQVTEKKKSLDARDKEVSNRDSMLDNQAKLVKEKEQLLAAKSMDISKKERMLHKLENRNHIARVREQSVARQKLFEAVCDGHVETVQWILNCWPLLKGVIFKNYRTPLLIAASKGHLSLVCYLVEETGADVDATDINGLSALNNAAVSQHTQTVKYLLQEAGADTELKNYLGETQLHHSSKKGHVEIVILLLKNGADKQARDNAGLTALHHAVKSGHLQVVCLLIKAGANVRAKDNKGQTVLHYAVLCNLDYKVHVEILYVLAQSTVFVSELRNDDGQTFLHSAILKQGCLTTEVMSILFQHCGTNMEVTNVAGLTVLQCAVKKGYLSEVQYLVEETCANTMVRDEEGRTLLHLAAMEGHLSVVKYLVHEVKMDVNVKDYCGWTADELAASHHTVKAFFFQMFFKKFFFAIGSVVFISLFVYIATYFGALHVVKEMFIKSKSQISNYLSRK